MTALPLVGHEGSLVKSFLLDRQLFLIPLVGASGDSVLLQRTGSRVNCVAKSTVDLSEVSREVTREGSV